MCETHKSLKIVNIIILANTITYFCVSESKLSSQNLIQSLKNPTQTMSRKLSQ